jgi:uncharacterized membrane protein (DUF373 family)
VLLDLVKKLEGLVTLVLIALLAVVVVLATVELGYTIAVDVLSPPVLFPGIDRLLDIFGRLLLVVIGIELLETIRAFGREGVVRAEIVLMVTIIALARKIILIELGHVSTGEMIGLAAILGSLSLAYWVFVRDREGRTPGPPRISRLRP